MITISKDSLESADSANPEQKFLVSLFATISRLTGNVSLSGARTSAKTEGFKPGRI